MSSIKFLTDENFESAILRGLLRREPDLDIIRVQDHDLANTDDLKILTWAAQNNRVLLTHDLRTMPDFAYQKIAKGQKMVGVVVMRPDIKVGTAIDDILLIVACMTIDEMKNTVLRLPL